jgi:hypothetical protein
VALAHAARVKVPLITVIAVALFVYFVFKYARRQYFLRHLVKARISAVELKRRLEAGDALVIVDLRTTLDPRGSSLWDPGSALVRPRDAFGIHTT